MEVEKQDFIDLDLLAQRLELIIDKFGKTNKEFSDKSGLSPTKISNVLNHKAKLSIDDINELVRNCSDLMPSPEWFLLGRDTSSPNHSPMLFQEEDKNYSYLVTRIEELVERNNSLKIENEELNKSLKALEKTKKEIDKEIVEIKVYYKNNSFETYLLEDKDSDY